LLAALRAVWRATVVVARSLTPEVPETHAQAVGLAVKMGLVQASACASAGAALLHHRWWRDLNWCLELMVAVVPALVMCAPGVPAVIVLAWFLSERPARLLVFALCIGAAGGVLFARCRPGTGLFWQGAYIYGLGSTLASAIFYLVASDWIDQRRRKTI
jgi:hypothetical protein